ncbi:MAG: DUF4276 family protein [Methanothrix sp.]|jgi:hypothetical protein|nr:DUF4276 family protein [Methanothrix sp.]
MHIVFLVEELSAESALLNLVPKILGTSASFEIHPYQCKDDLLLKLPRILRGYAKWLPDNWRIVVLVDEDRSECDALKERMEQAADDARLITRTMAGSLNSHARFQVLNRIAIEELEAWFFGDVLALNQAYPKVPKTLGGRSRYQDPDSITGGTWESMERELKKAGYFRGGLRKIEAAKTISAFMEPERNKSKSFQVFRDGLQEMVRRGI